MVEIIQPITEPAYDELTDAFNYHADAWEDAAFLTMEEMFADEDYQRIIEMGPQVVPLILRRLQAQPRWWSPALIKLTGVDPTAGQARGRLAVERKAWLEWAEQQGYLTDEDKD